MWGPRTFVQLTGDPSPRIIHSAQGRATALFNKNDRSGLHVKIRDSGAVVFTSPNTHKRGITMATKKTKGPDAEKVQWQGFVNVYLTRTEKDHVKRNPLPYPEALGFLADAAASGYKVSVSWSERPGFFTVTLYGNLPGHPNAGWAMSIRHADILTAVSALHHVAGQDGLKSDWGERFDTASGHDW